jgi:hypothetical protein
MWRLEGSWVSIPLCISGSPAQAVQVDDLAPAKQRTCEMGLDTAAVGLLTSLSRELHRNVILELHAGTKS